MIWIFFNLFIYFISGCVGSSFLCEGFLQLWQVGATLHRGALASHCRGLSCCRTQAPDAQAQQLWLTVLVAPRHVGSSQTRARTCVPCISRQSQPLRHQGSPNSRWFASREGGLVLHIFLFPFHFIDSLASLSALSEYLFLYLPLLRKRCLTFLKLRPLENFL